MHPAPVGADQPGWLQDEHGQEIHFKARYTQTAARLVEYIQCEMGPTVRLLSDDGRIGPESLLAEHLGPDGCCIRVHREQKGGGGPAAFVDVSNGGEQQRELLLCEG